MNDYGLLVITSPNGESIRMAHHTAIKMMPKHVSKLDLSSNSFTISGETEELFPGEAPILWAYRNSFKGWCKRTNREVASSLLEVNEIVK